MGTCSECNIVISRGGLEVLTCVKCRILVHFACANFGILKKSFQKFKKGQVDYVCKICSPLPNSATSPVVSGNSSAIPGTTTLQDADGTGVVPPTLISVAALENAGTLPPGLAKLLRKVVSDGQSEVLAQSREISARFSKFETR